MNQYVNE